MTRAAVLLALAMLALVAWYYRRPAPVPPPWLEEPDGVPAWDTYQAAVLARR